MPATICPIRHEAGVDWGQLPAGRKWGSTASVTTRSGRHNLGNGSLRQLRGRRDDVRRRERDGRSHLSIPTIRQARQSFGAGLFVSPHKLTVDDGGNLWMADNGAHQVVKMTPDGLVLLTLGKKRRRRFRQR